MGVLYSEQNTVFFDEQSKNIAYFLKGLGSWNGTSLVLVYSPSERDQLLTQELCLSGKMVGIEVLDHIIIGFSNHVSVKD